ncbi:MAG: PAS domain S-box protein [Caldimonas sp.]
MPDDQQHDSARGDGDLFRLLVSHLTDCAMFVVDRNGVVQGWNVGAEQLFGYVESEIIGRSLERFFTPEDVEAGVPQQEMKDALHTGIGPDDRWHLRKDGSRFWASGLLTPVRDAAGEVCGFAKILRDRTPWKLQQDAAEDARSRQEARVTAILDTALDCIITINALGHVLEFNPAAERTFGYRRADVLGRELSTLIIPESLRAAHHRGLAHYLATGEGPVLGKRIELAAMRADGTEFPVELAITRIATDGSPLFTAYLREISDRVWAGQLRNARFAITQHLAQARDLETAAVGVLRSICENLHWEVGAFWVVGSEAESLTCLTTWHEAGTPGATFAIESRRRTFLRGEGLPGQVWATGEFAWLLDVPLAPNFPRAALAAAAGLQSAFAFPILVGGATHSVMEFFTRQVREPDSGLLETMATVAGQVGQFLKRLHAEQTLRESEGRFRALMEQAPFSVQILSPDGQTSRVNQAWSNLWGVSLEQLAGYNILQDLQLESTGVAPYLRRAFAGEAVAIPEIRYDPNETLPGLTRHSDPVRWVSAVAYPLKDSGDRVREVVLVHDDITARKAAEGAVRESEEKLRLLVDTIPQLAWMARRDGHIFWYNRRWYDYTGTTPDEMEGWGWQSVHDPAVLPEVLSRWDASITRGDPFDMVFPIKGADGQFRPFLTRVNPLRDAAGQIVYWFGTNTDISDIKRMEQALRDADRRKDEFLATLAHELRNPLAPIRNSLQILKVPNVDPATATQTRDMMERQVNHLVRLVDDLMDVSRVVRGKIELQKAPVELATVVARAVEMAQPLIDEHQHRLDIATADESLLVDADAVRLTQVLSNLLINAAKYTDAGGHIRVFAERQAGQGVLRVQDNGIGIAPDVLPHVFDLFVQGQAAAARSPSGLGVGLTLVRDLVEMHGGTAEARSAGTGAGAEFTIRLPLITQHRKQLAEIGDTAHVPPTSHRILVVDDNIDAAASLAVIIQMQGHEVRVAHDGISALDTVRAYQPSLIFLDIGMPKMDGYEVARRLRHMPDLQHTVLAALTGWGQPEDRRRSKEAGFDHHLVKPLEIDVLEDLLAGLSRPGLAAG